MKVNWTARALDDLARIYEFLAPLNPKAAQTIVRNLSKAANSLEQYPRSGPMIEGLELQETRRLIVDQYELRYEIMNQEVFIAQIWHAREDR